jgi:hypothetical protein
MSHAAPPNRYQHAQTARDHRRAESVDAAGFYRTTGNTVWWGMREGHVEPFDAAAAAPGYQVFRPELIASC